MRDSNLSGTFKSTAVSGRSELKRTGRSGGVDSKTAKTLLNTRDRKSPKSASG